MTKMESSGEPGSEQQNAANSNSAEVLQDLGPLNGLPGDAKFINVVGKAPTERDWNAHPDKWLTV